MCSCSTIPSASSVSCCCPTGGCVYFVVILCQQVVSHCFTQLLQVSINGQVQRACFVKHYALRRLEGLPESQDRGLPSLQETRGAEGESAKMLRWPVRRGEARHVCLHRLKVFHQQLDQLALIQAASSILDVLFQGQILNRLAAGSLLPVSWNSVFDS